MFGKLMLLGVLCLNLSVGLANVQPLDQSRASFLRIEKLIKSKNTELLTEQISDLSDYPLYPYLMHQWLVKRLHHEAEIQSFIKAFPDNRHAQSLRRDWFQYLVKQKAWQSIVSSYEKNDDIASQCQYFWALYNTDNKPKALNGMAKIWPTGEQLPSSCLALEQVFVKSSVLTSAAKWTRFELALKQDNTRLAKQILPLFSKDERRKAHFWLRVHNKPNIIVKKQQWNNKYNKAALIFAHGIERLSRKNLAKALKTWDERQKEFNLSKLRSQEVEKALAIWMVVRRDKSAYKRFNQLVFTDQEIREWRVRAALLENNWVHVVAALNRLNHLEKLQPKWQYWRARAYWESGEEKIAKRIFTELADKRSFYGFVAADYTGQGYQLTEKKIKLPKFKLTNFVKNNEFKAVQEFMFFKREKDARQQWLSALDLLPEWQIPAAAFLAQEQGWDQFATETIKRAGYKSEAGLRFPLSFRDQVIKHAQQRKIDPAIVFSLIRRESAFNKNAVSRVGARGLMQIMPETGKYIAKKLKESWQTVKVLFDPETNLRFGTFYYKRMLDQFNGNFALAAAAYNAGPHRVNRWLPDKQKLPADVWIEMIPFDETRKYVYAVLTNAIIYQHRLNRNSLRMSDLLKEIQPRSI